MIVSLVSLGCPRNLIDSEVLVGRLAGNSFRLQQDPAGADVVVVNTCGFIDAAREESIDTICEMLELKARGEVKGVVVAGCMVRRYGADLTRELPDVDAFLDISDYSDAPEVFRAIASRVSGSGSPGSSVAGTPFFGGGGPKTASVDLGRTLLTLPHTAYLRVSEGCDRKCSFCAIPGIRGRQRSKPIEILMEEAEQLARAGVIELNLIGEETTAYGSDLGMAYGEGIVVLIRALATHNSLRWIRLLYAHPGSFRPSLTRELLENPKLVPYLDVPIQHGDDEILKRMRRGTPVDAIRRMVSSLREEVPDMTLRTTVLVGFPGETERRFGRLLALLEEARFDRLGCFAYSREEGTDAHGLKSRVSARVAAERRRQVMTLQREITARRNEALVGRTLEVLIDQVEDGLATGRTAGDAPQIDCRVELAAEGRRPGMIVDALVTGTDGYDLQARLSSPVGAGP
ncbi:MAG: 30S ribosomal protein S12 methylthiotransferase RimO [Planctomycetota bacterium]